MECRAEVGEKEPTWLDQLAPGPTKIGTCLERVDMFGPDVVQLVPFFAELSLGCFRCFSFLSRPFEFEHLDSNHTIFVPAKVAFLNLGYFDASRFYWDPRMNIWHCTGLKGT